MNSEGSDLRIFKERMCFSVSNKEIETDTMKSKLYKEKGEDRESNPVGKDRMFKEIDDFKELMYWGSNEKIGRMGSVVSN